MTELEIQLNKSIFSTGGKISGILICRMDRATAIESISVGVSGFEAAAGSSIAQALHKNQPFFEREIMLSGRERSHGIVARMSRIWNAMLGRYSGRAIVPGEHVYPFSIPLPASLPPSYDGRAGKIEYRVTATVKYPITGALKANEVCQIALVPKSKTGRPISITHPNSRGPNHPTQIEMGVDLSRRSAEAGGSFSGNVRINNPADADIAQLIIKLESCEGTRGTCTVAREIADEIRVDKPGACSNFELKLPNDSPPTVEGTEVSVVWFLRISLETDPAFDFSTPITVFSNIDSGTVE